MNDLSAPFRQLVERRLWPLAVLLLAALVAVPLLLAKDVVEAPVGSSSVAAVAAQADTQPVVALGQVETRESARQVLGSRKNPFEPAIPERRVKAPKAARSQSTGSTGGASTGGASAGGGLSTGPVPPLSGGGTPVTAPTAPVAPAAPKPAYELYSLRVRWGDSTESPLPKRNLKRLTALPDSTAPALIYLGLLDDKKTAVFLVDATATVQGDGRCRPTPDNCQTLEMRVGDTAFVDVADDRANSKQYQIDLVKIRTKKTTDAKAAKRSYAAESSSGRRALRSRVSRVAGFDYDRDSGTLRRKSRDGSKSAR